MREDAAYRGHFRRYTLGILALCAGTVFQPHNVTPGILASVAMGVAIVYLAFHQQHYMNQRVGEILVRTVR